MFIWRLDKASIFVLAAGVLSSIMLAVFNILYAYMRVEWIMTACRISGLISLCAIVLLAHYSKVSKNLN